MSVAAKKVKNMAKFSPPDDKEREISGKQELVRSEFSRCSTIGLDYRILSVLRKNRKYRIWESFERIVSEKVPRVPSQEKTLASRQEIKESREILDLLAKIIQESCKEI